MKSAEINRRQLMVSAAAFGVAYGALGAAYPAIAQTGRVVRLADGQIGQADPHRTTDFPGSILMFNLYDFLIRPLPRGELEPSLAESWEISEDGTVYTFRIRQGVKFHDGTELTAHDVVYSMNRIRTMQRGYAFLFQVVDSAEVLDTYVAQIRLQRPFAPFLGALVRLAIVNGERVQANVVQPGDYGDAGDYGEAFLSQADAGSGPYTLEIHDPQVETVMQLYPDYFAGHAENAPLMARSKFGVEAASIRALMPRRELELTRLPLPNEVMEALAATPGIVVGQDRSPSIYHFKLNTRKAPTDDLNFRKAIALAFDYDQLYSLLEVAGQSSGLPIRGPVPWGVMGYDPDVPLIRRDIEAARAALAASRYADNPPELEFVWNRNVASQERFGLLLQSNLAELGIRLNMTSAPWPQIVQMATSPEATAHINCVSCSLSTPDIDSMIFAEYHSSATGTYLSMEWFSTPEIDALLEEARRVGDPARRDEIYRNAATLIREAYPALYLFQANNVVALQDYLNVPALTDEDRAIPVMAANYQFRLMSMRV